MGVIAATILQIDEAKRKQLSDFGKYASSCLPKYVQKVQVDEMSLICLHECSQFAAGDELELLIHPTGVLPVAHFLKGHHAAQFTNITYTSLFMFPVHLHRADSSPASTSLRAKTVSKSFTSFCQPYSMHAFVCAHTRTN
jgi:NADH dehydrogenase (ubiquinone) Fe-S protein 3